MLSGFIRWILLALIVSRFKLIYSSSSKDHAQHHDAYSPSSARVSKDFDNAKLRQLGFVYNPNEHIAKEDVRHIRNSKARAKMLHPDEEREVRRPGVKHAQVKDGIKTKITEWRGTGTSNATWLEEQRVKANARSKAQDDRHRAKSDEMFAQSGKRLLSKKWTRYKQRMAFARSGDGDEMMQFRTGGVGRASYIHPQQLTKAEYVKQQMQKLNQRDKRSNQERKAERNDLALKKTKKLEASGESQAKQTGSTGNSIVRSYTPAASPKSGRNSSPSSSDSHWSQLSDIVKLPDLKQ